MLLQWWQAHPLLACMLHFRSWKQLCPTADKFYIIWGALREFITFCEFKMFSMLWNSRNNLNIVRLGMKATLYLPIIVNEFSKLGNYLQIFLWQFWFIFDLGKKIEFKTVIQVYLWNCVCYHKNRGRMLCVCVLKLPVPTSWWKSECTCGICVRDT